MNGKRVLAFGWYGAGNLGDELLLDTLKAWCAERDARVAAISIDPEYTRALHGIEAIDLHDLPGIAHAMRSTDLFVLGGGGLFQSHQAFTIAGLYDFTMPDVAVYARPLLMARQMGVRTAVWAQGLGPLEGAEATQIVRDLFGQADYLSVRDEGSRRLLQEAGVERQITVAPDPIWAKALPTVPLLATEGSLRIGIVLRGWPFTKGWEDSFIHALKASIGSRGATLVWLPFQPHSVPGRSGSDLEFIRPLMQRVGDEYRHELVTWSNLEEPIEILAGCHAVIAMRLHAQILALRLAKPTLCIEYDDKMAATSKQVGLAPGYRLAIDAPAEEWLEKVTAWWVSVRSGSAVVALVGRLAEAALAHRSLLHAALDAELQRSSSWMSAGFDWLGAWQQKAHDSALKQRDQVLLRLNEILADAQKNNGALVGQLVEREAQTKVILSELNGRIEAQGVQMSRMEAELEQMEKMLEQAKQKLEDAEQARVEQVREIGSKQQQIDELRDSTSWRITRPLRFVRYFLRAPAFALREARRALLPVAPREASVKGRGAAQEARAKEEKNGLPWDAFRTRVLAKRDEYKGIFIQEPIIGWNVPLYQRPQHLSTALARLGYLVIYKTGAWSGVDDVEGFHEVEPNVWLTDSWEVDSIKGAIRSIYSTAYAHNPAELLVRPDDSVLVYEYIDHIDSQISGEPENIKRLLALKDWAFAGGADVVVASARVLEAEAVSEVGRNKVVLVPNGVDTRHYRSSNHVETLLPESLSAFRVRYRTIVGYFGAIAPWLWYDALHELIAARPDLGFVFIGPDYYGGVERLPHGDNVLYLGAVDYKILPAYARQFDVCFIPFEPGEIARSTSPLKLFEYFALEKPVVVTADMLECVAYPEVFAGDSPQALGAAIDAAIGRSDDPEFQERLATLADENDWTARAKVLSDFCNELLGHRRGGDGRPSLQTKVA